MFRLITLDEVDSTNSWLKRNLEQLDGNVAVTADRQTAGRGRLGRTWFTDEHGGLAVSVLLRDKELFSAYSSNISGLTQYAAVVLCHVLRQYGVNPIIKWPNDIITVNGKLAGILSEAVVTETGVDAVIIGMGVNLNSSCEILMHAGQPATSVALETGRSVKKIGFVTILLDLFFGGCQEFLKKGFSGIRDEYCGYFSSSIGRVVTVASAGSSITGKVLGVDAAGHLLLEDNLSGKISIHAGEIQC